MRRSPNGGELLDTDPLQDHNQSTMHDLAGLPSEDAIREHAYLVSRGVRPFALVGDCDADLGTMNAVMRALDSVAMPYTRQGAIPFVIAECQKDFARADYGYAASPWIIDLWKWLMNTNEEAVPAVQRNRLRGLILGYDAAAIRYAEDANSGQCFPL